MHRNIRSNVSTEKESTSVNDELAGGTGRAALQTHLIPQLSHLMGVVGRALTWELNLKHTWVRLRDRNTAEMDNLAQIAGQKAGE